ncbi:MAG TPA: beta-galactosidase [Candidatus Saccharimonadales bacterium]|nr:beta-galactosidase [Candidatus Saccharimonadales bacterium]
MIDPARYGVSFSAKQCRNFKISTDETLDWLIKTAGFRRFRLMSYWDEHEKQPGTYDFKELDKQISLVEAAGGVITLCLGARQPRWPENHWPDWAWEQDKEARTEALLRYIETVVRRYRSRGCIVSYQLENEALLKSFGRRPEVDRKRLRAEFALVKRLDPTRPVIMSTSTSWGIPLRRPVPDIVGFSYYQVLYNSKEQRYTTAFHTPLLHRVRAGLIRLTTGKPVFIHELQLEPWGPKGIWDMPPVQQDESMGPVRITKNLALARAVHRYPIDLWGGEWWYWRTMKQKDKNMWTVLKRELEEKR